MPTRKRILKTIIKEIEQKQKVLNAHIKAYMDVINWLPTATMKELSTLVKNKSRGVSMLDSTVSAFMSSIVLRYNDRSELIVEQDKSDARNFLGIAVEEGLPSFPMATAQAGLKGNIVPVGQRGVHMSKKGFRYRIIPIQIHGNRAQAETHESMLFMRNILPLFEKKPRWKPETAFQKDPFSGVITARQQMDDPRQFAKGVFKLRRYANEEAVAKGYKHGESTKIVIFRTMSESHPEKFVHPGFVGIHAIKQVVQIMDSRIYEVWQSYVKKELGRI